MSITDLFNPDFGVPAQGTPGRRHVLDRVRRGRLHVVLCGMAFIAHAVFPGLAVALVTSGNPILGGTLAGVLPQGVPGQALACDIE